MHGGTQLSPSGQAVGGRPCRVYGDSITPEILFKLEEIFVCHIGALIEIM